MISRERALSQLQSNRFDIVVIGGGITGAGVALDAATRGYSVAIVEGRDWSAGTSSRSSKMIHGGLRYLQNFDLGLVREALIERQLMVQLAPHLVKPLPFLVPWFEGGRRDRLIGVALNMYDVMARGNRRARRRAEREALEEGSEYWSPDRHRTIPGEEAVELIPAARAAQPHLRIPLLRLPDRRLTHGADGARRGRALRGGGGERRARGRADRGERHGRRGRLPGAGVRRAVRGRRRQRRQRDRRLGGPHPPGGAARRGGRAGASGRAAAPTS